MRDVTERNIKWRPSVAVVLCMMRLEYVALVTIDSEKFACGLRLRGNIVKIKGFVCMYGAV